MLFNPIREFPTTHVLIDNDINYLRGLSTILPLQNKIYRYFLGAEEALIWINRQPNKEEKILSKDCDYNDINSNFLVSGISRVHESIYVEDRFNSISTVIVDYDMPGLNGIELCRLIKNTDIQKILITGFLGEKEARHALNKGWIDMFLPKGEDSSQKIAELIYDAEYNYFKRSDFFLKTFISHSKAEITESEGFLKFFKEAFTESNAIEFYLLSPDGDYLFINAEGVTTGFSVQDARKRRENFELAQELSVSDEILRGLKSGRILFCNSEIELPEARNWEHFIFPARVVDEKKDLLGAFSREVFFDKSCGIAAFKPVFDQSINDAVKVLNGYR
jgi:CheY-like chemotaxis protein